MAIMLQWWYQKIMFSSHVPIIENSRIIWVYFATVRPPFLSLKLCSIPPQRRGLLLCYINGFQP